MSIKDTGGNMEKPQPRLFLYFLFTVVKYIELKLWKSTRSLMFYKKWTVRKLLWRRGSLARPATHIGVAALALLAIVGGTIFGPLPSLAFQNLHPSTNADIIAPQTTIQTVVPKDRPRATSIQYEITSGDTLSAVATKYNVSVDSIKWATGLTSDGVNPGQKVIIPPVTGVVHTVAKGETLASIANDHGVAGQSIIDFPFNDIQENLALTTGQVLVIPGGRPTNVVHPPAPTYHATYVSSVVNYFATGGNSYPFGQCTWYVATKRNIPWTDNAGGWYRAAIASGFRVGRAPAAGAIMVSYEGSVYGHVSYVERVNGDGSWVVSEMNYFGVAGGGWGRVDHRTINPGTVFVVGFVY
jgi:surface antigen